MIRVDLVTGFLGSGKTTFITDYATNLVNNDEKVAIITNDYGAINVDRMILESNLSGKCHVEMVIGGDKDCSRRRLKTKLIALAMDKYEHVIVEPSGVFDVNDFFDLIFDAPLDRWYEIGSVISIVEAGIIKNKDCSYGEKYLTALQVSKAGKVVISKSDADYKKNVTENNNKIIDILNEFLGEFACTRTIKDVLLWEKGELSGKDTLLLEKAGYMSGEMIKLPVEEDSTFESLFFFHPKVKVKDVKDNIDRAFRDDNNGKIHRIKGYLKNAYDMWIEINAVRDNINLKPVETGQELFIVIGESLNKENISKYFN
ncbi:MAG: GTPase (G3E family) [Lachnospiraceae bacterium]|nr:GTPase (G3E family) [Lachnospiraceae bacterium]